MLAIKNKHYESVVPLGSREGSLHTFAAVADKYETTRPVISHNHTKREDIRPIGKRRRKSERVELVNRNKYVLHDVLPCKESQGWKNKYWTPYLKRPPIVWERRNGREQVTVRGAVRSGGDTSRYNFLREWLPFGLKFDNWETYGTHAIKIHSQTNYRDKAAGTYRGITCLLLESYHLPRPENSNDNTDYYLTFQRNVDVGAEWKLISPEYSRPRKVVDRKKKAKLKQDITSFYEWVSATGSLLRVDDYSYVSRLQDEVHEYIESSLNNEVRDNIVWSQDTQRYMQNRYYKHRCEMPSELAVEIIKDYTHPLRIHLGCYFLEYMNGNRHGYGTPTIKQLKSSYNRWINKTLEFNHVVKSKKIREFPNKLQENKT